jgi:hypothetical protein
VGGKWPWGSEQVPTITEIPTVVPSTATPTYKPIPTVPISGDQGITAGWLDPGKNLTIVSRDKFWILDLVKGEWTTQMKYVDYIKAQPGSVWASASLKRVDGVLPWEGEGITAGWLDPGKNLTIVSRDKFWILDLVKGEWTTQMKYVDYIKAQPGSVWAKISLKPIENRWPWGPFVAPTATEVPTLVPTRKPVPTVGLPSEYGITAGWIDPGKSLTVVSKDKFWILDISSTNVNSWTWTTQTTFAQYVKDHPGLAWGHSSLKKIDGYYPWEGEGITAAWINPGKDLTVVSRDKFWVLDIKDSNPSNWIWTTQMKYTDYIKAQPTSVWASKSLQTIGGRYPWEGEGITAGWVDPERSLTVVSKDRFWILNLLTKTWTTQMTFEGYRSANDGTAWNSLTLKKVNGYFPWEGEGITAGWIDKGKSLTVVSRDKFWVLDISNSDSTKWGWTTQTSFSQYRKDNSTYGWGHPSLRLVEGRWPWGSDVISSITPTLGQISPTVGQGVCQVCAAGKPGKNKGNADCDDLVDFKDYAIWRREYFDEGGRGTITKDDWQANFDCTQDNPDKLVTGVDFQKWLDVCVIDPNGQCNK